MSCLFRLLDRSDLLEVLFYLERGIKTQFVLDLVIDSSVHASTGAFVVCWTPGLVTLLLDGLLGKDSHANTYEKFCLVMAECNSLVNPIIYTLRDEELRRTFRWILCSLCRRNGQREVSPIEFAPAPNTPQVHVQDA